jgi:hypothetical protein
VVDLEIILNKARKCRLAEVFIPINGNANHQSYILFVVSGVLDTGLSSPPA